MYWLFVFFKKNQLKISKISHLNLYFYFIMHLITVIKLEFL